MYLCRRQLLRVVLSKSSSCPFSIRRPSSHATRHIPLISTAKGDRVRRLGTRSLYYSARLASQHTELSTDDVFSALCEDGRNLLSTISATDLYAQLRAQSLDSVAKLPAASYFRILDEAYNDSNNLIDTICKDIVDLFQGTREEQRLLLHSIILNANLMQLCASTLLSALDQLEQLSDGMDTSILGKITRFVTEHEGRPQCEPLVRRVHQLLVKRLHHFRVPAGASSLTFYPHALVHTIFNFTHKLASYQGQLALDLLHVLFDRGFIPTEAVQTSKNISAVVSATLVRASLYWNWRALAANILLDLLRTAQPSDQFVFELAVETSYALLVTPRSRDICDCLSLFLRMHRLAPIPSGLVRQFYSTASRCLRGEEAATFYSFSRSTSIMKQHQYPTPQGPVLAWLMHHFTTTSRRLYLSRVLAAEVVEDNVPIIPQFRARFISLAASRGYSTLARRLWVRYSTGKDSHLIVGDSALMLRMTTLFAYLVRRTDSQIRTANKSTDVETLHRQLQDFTSFRDHVLWSYRRHYGPLTDAPHNVITSFARACFIVGTITEGFDAFKVLLRRKEIPDMYDINVALSAIAKDNPRSALSIVTRLKDRGIQPDAVSYATVMHFAKLQGDAELVLQMMDQLHSLDRSQLSLKSIAALVRVTVAFEDDESKRSQRQKLRDAMSIITKLASNRFLPSPQTGKYLVIASLRADDPVMAFRFWNLLLRESADWNDKEQASQRQLISQKIEKHQRRGWLDDEKVANMLERLEQRPGTQ
ncbi:hypothetical protein APHAL10511_002555 [Amanita phalloides]|nr:hypothetical protein APHAL10511_002555 [Amanita phalloides]